VIISVDGGADAKALAAQLRIERQRFRRGIARAMSDRLENFTVDLRHASETLLPKSGGYNQIMAAAVRADPSVKTAWPPVVDVRVRASSRTRRGRIIGAVDAGRLTHPHWRSRKYWYTTVVPPGFVTDTFEQQRDDLVEAIEDEWDAMVRRIETTR
jgi:hypothetical protein